MVIGTPGARMIADLVSSQLWPWKMRAGWMEAWLEVYVLCILLPVFPEECTSVNWTLRCLISLWWQSRVPLLSLAPEFQDMPSLFFHLLCLMWPCEPGPFFSSLFSSGISLKALDSYSLSCLWLGLTFLLASSFFLKYVYGWFAYRYVCACLLPVEVRRGHKNLLGTASVSYYISAGNQTQILRKTTSAPNC